MSLFFFSALACPTPEAPPPEKTAAAPPKAAARSGDPYPFATCPVSGKKLGEMGSPVTRLYEGREVRFCCDACPATFEKQIDASLRAVDDKIAADQGSLYPTANSIVTGKTLPAKPIEFVFGNRLIRVSDETERKIFESDPSKYLALLNKAVIEAQSPGYPLLSCPVSDEKFGGEMGEAVNVVVAGRLIRICCDSCADSVEAAPAKYLLLLDTARAAKKAPAGAEEGAR
ncbi:MAG: hypothetical protein ACREJD_14585 [Phycisphaerales bacterium]